MIENPITTKIARPAGWMSNYKSKLMTAEQAMSFIKSDSKMFIHPGCAIPVHLVEALVKRKSELKNVEIYHILTVGPAPYVAADMEGSFHHTALFIGANVREAINSGRADFMPIFLFEVPNLFTSGLIPLDYSLVQLSTPDEHGFCSYGVDVGTVKSAAESSKLIIAQVNKNMPRSLGNSFIHVNKLSAIVEFDAPIKELPQVKEGVTEDERKVFSIIGEQIAGLIEDGSTLQMGIGAIPDSVLNFLKNKKNLGIHSEMFSDGLIELIDNGVVNNEKKTLHQGKIIAGFVLGTKRSYDYIDNNPIFEFHPQEYVNNPFIIAQNEKMVAINSAIEIDLTGQVCSDSIGTRFFSGIGGQVDFIRGASMAKGGKPIIALPSTTKNNTISRIVTTLKSGAGVVTSRGDVHYVVTEFGVVNLFGKSIRQRVLGLINIAHPDFRDELKFYAQKNKFI